MSGKKTSRPRGLSIAFVGSDKDVQRIRGIIKRALRAEGMKNGSQVERVAITEIGRLHENQDWTDRGKTHNVTVKKEGHRD